uniref:Retrovirus-related Pol polyprotein from transposon TNT 1-94 n=1 Tax=Tanacetum cinerariifolium TaxID=118510 RepID=A0A6L2LRD0_TANCI|nr:retrovirus-related Pol polyprotein from transposon TNT 1-94 [Tanacetum cinerariifolium]
MKETIVQLTMSKKHKGKEIAKAITPPSETTSEENNDLEQAQRDKDMQKNLALIAKYFKKIYKTTNNNLRTSSNSGNKNVDTTLRYKNDNQSRQFGNQRMVNVVGAKENVGSLVMQQSGIQYFNYTDEEIDEQELEAHYSYMEKIQEVPTADSGTDSEPLEQNDQNDVESNDERVALANLIANLKLDVDENKKIQNQLKKANTTLAQELKECKPVLAKTSKTLGESISVRDSCLVALQNKQTEFEKYKAFNDRTIDYYKLERQLNETLGQLALKDIEIKEGLKTKAYEISVVKQKHDELIKQSLLTKSHYEGLVKQKTKVIMDLKLREEHAIDKMLSMEKQLKFLNEIVYKRSQSTQTIHMMAPKIRKTFDFIEIALQKCKEPVKNDTVWNERASNVFRKEREQYIEIQDLKAQLQDKNIAISELKKLIEKGKGKSMETKFDKPSVVRQSNAQRIPKPSVLGVNHKTNVSRPQHRSNQLKDKVLPNNSQVKLKKTQVEEHHRIPSISNKMKDLVQGNITINRVYYVEGLNHNLFSVGQFCDADLEDIVIGLPKLKYVKDQLCSSCEVSKAKRSSFKSKAVPSSKGRLNFLHMDLCGPMRVASINEKKYILVIVDDYSRYTWTLFLRSKDETPEVLKEFLTMIQRNLQAPVITERTERGTEFLNKTLNAFFKEEGIEHQTSTARTPEQNGVVKRQNHTLVKAA